MKMTTRRFTPGFRRQLGGVALIVLGVIVLAVFFGFFRPSTAARPPSPAISNANASAPTPAPTPNLPPAAPDDVVIGNDHLEVRVGATDDRRGALTVVDKATGLNVGQDLGHSIELADGTEYRLPGDIVARGVPIEATGVPSPLGPANELLVPYSTIDDVLQIDMTIAVPAAGSSFFLQIGVRENGEPSDAHAVLYFRALDDGAGSFNLVSDPQFLSDATTVLSQQLAEGDSLDELIGMGSPAYFSGVEGGGAVVLAPLDETTQWTRVTATRGSDTLAVGVETGAVGRLADEVPQVDAVGTTWSPRLLFDLAPSDTRTAFARYKQAIDKLYPEAPVPSWLGPQWDSYWAFDLDITQDVVMASADAIDGYFKDLGPWSIIFDAGWYLDGGVPGSSPDTINTDKFPDGLAPVIDALHQRDIRSILYFSAPYIDRRVAADPSSFEGPPSWMALAGFIDRYPDFIRSLSSRTDGPSFIYDFLNPGLIEYMRGLMNLYLNDFGGDGILLDLVGEAQPAVTDGAAGERAPGGRVPLVADYSQEVYKVIADAVRAAKPDADVEGAWLNPVVSRSNAISWRYGDEVPEFSFTYPEDGLVEKIDYATIQREMLGMRPHIGYIRGPATAPPIQRWWMGAALALDAQFGISIDMSQLTPEAAQIYREYLAQYKPFQGTTRFGPGIQPDWFATTRDGVTYLGLVNRGDDDKIVEVPLKDMGMDSGRRAIAYDPEEDSSTLVDSSLLASLAPQSFRLYVLRDTPGPVWGSRRLDVSNSGNSVVVNAAPSPMPDGGRVLVYAPAAKLQVTTPGSYQTLQDPSELYRVRLSDPGAARIVISSGR